MTGALCSQIIRNGNGPPVNFQSLLHYMIDNYTGRVPAPLTTSPPVTLPSLPMTVEEFNESCRVNETCVVSSGAVCV